MDTAPNYSDSEERNYTIFAFTENKVGLLNRIVIIFTRRHINIESLTASESEVPGVYRYTIIIRARYEQVEKLVKQISKQVDVLRASFYPEDETVFQEMALYKIPMTSLISGHEVEKIVRDSYARILTVDPQYIIIEKTGHLEETKALFEQLKPFGILQFSRSGRVAITKHMKDLSTYLREQAEAHL
ncbi:acetolactate synthase small subunit [Adhaeribacter aerolatus]|uniref:Acetolactate synthase small subunit n=1 Tax=Adhaeribacter aerolatus TaxID=670289 RepID=A0A512B529_9BACT|nr:acetolactate synthase small subunit [Adhaeribacter aerolatus]GEO07086.1 acetolactate synthase small subunit [Adhaeribacter aerolatus]